MKLVVASFSLVVIPFFAHKSIAADQTTLLDPIIISSSRIPTTLDLSITNITVIDRQVIESSQAASVTELLRQQGGVHVQQGGSRGAIGSIFLRNNDPNFVAVIIDGVKVNDPTNSRGGSFDFSSIDINSIERIEIVKGAMSSMYGSDALAGAIYITTRPAKDDTEKQLAITKGSRDYGEASALVQQRLGKTDMSLNVAYIDEGEQTDFSKFINRSVNLNTDSFIASGKKLSVRARHSKSDAKSLPDDSGGEDFAVIRDVDQRQIQESSLGFQYSHDMTAEWSYSIEASKFLHDENVVSPGVEVIPTIVAIPPNTSNSEFSREYLLWNNSIEISNRLQISLGLDKQWEEGTSYGSYDDPVYGDGVYSLKRETNGGFIETLFGSVDAFTVKLGLRYDDPEHASSQTTGNLGLRYRQGYYVFTASAGSGYKLPSFYALGNFLVGDPNLVAEESQYWELGIKRSSVSQRSQIHFNVYAYEFDNLIDFDSATFRLVNRKEVTSEGVEAGVRHTLSTKSALSIALHYSETDIVDSSVKLRNRPRWRATGQYQHKFTSALSSMASLLYVDEVFESSIPTGDVTLDSYYRLDLSVNWQYSHIWLIKGAIDNLTDENYQETVGTDSPGITARVSVAAKF